MPPGRTRSPMCWKSAKITSSDLPIYDRHQGHKPMRHPQVGNVSGAHMIGMGDLHISQQIRINLVLWMRFTGVRPWVDRCQPHLGYQPSNPLPINHMPSPCQMRRHPPTTINRSLQKLLIYQAHHCQIVFLSLEDGSELITPSENWGP
jgi:hypothetical protein